jgi:hypothetical protein
MTQQRRNMQEGVTIDDKTLFAHLLVISLFVKSYQLPASLNNTLTKEGFCSVEFVMFRSYSQIKFHIANKPLLPILLSDMIH